MHKNECSGIWVAKIECKNPQTTKDNRRVFWGVYDALGWFLPNDDTSNRYAMGCVRMIFRKLGAHLVSAIASERHDSLEIDWHEEHYHFASYKIVSCASLSSLYINTLAKQLRGEVDLDESAKH